MSYRNALEEINKYLKDIIAADVSFGDYGEKEEFKLYIGFTKEDWNKFTLFMDRTYDAGFGGQELFGTIWLTNKRWLERGEYDGSEWWELKEYPPEPRKTYTNEDAY